MAEGGGGGLFRGSTKDQDRRFTDKEKQLLKSHKFAPEFETKVDTKKIQLDVIKPWISEKITQLLGFEDEVLIGFIFGLLEEKQFPDPKTMQINITGFLDTDAADFMKQLWKLLISAQENIGGIPQEFLEKKKEEIKARKAEQERIRLRLGQKLGQQDAPQNVEGSEIKKEDERSNRDRDRRDRDRDIDRRDRDRNIDRGDRDRDRDRDYRRDRDRSDRDRYERRDREKRKRSESPDDRERRRHRYLMCSFLSLFIFSW